MDCSVCKTVIQNNDPLKCMDCKLAFHISCAGLNVKRTDATKLWEFIHNEPKIFYRCDKCTTTYAAVSSNLKKITDNLKKLSKSTEMLEPILKMLQGVSENVNDQKEINKEALSYASAVKLNVNASKKVLKKPAVIVKPTAEQSRDDVKKLIHKTMNNGGFKIVDSINASNNGVIVLCDDNAECGKVAECLKVVNGLDVKVPEMKLPKIKIKNVMILADEFILEEDKKFEVEYLNNLKKRNAVLANAKAATILKYYKTKNADRFDILMQVDPKSYTEIMSVQRLIAGNERCKVIDGTIIIRCFKCCAFGHFSKDCQKPKACFKCGGNHLAKNCQVNELKCSNCVAEKRQNDVNHSVLSNDCPQYIKVLKKVTRSTKYNE